MKKYAKVINKETGECCVGLGTNDEFYKEIGMKLLEVKQSDVDNQWYLSERCPDKTEEEKEQQERERLNMLSLTAADVERAIYKSKGMDFDDIIEFVKSNAPEDIDIKALKIELKANNFYRGNSYVEQIGALLGYNSDELDYLFENKELPAKALEADADQAEDLTPSAVTKNDIEKRIASRG